MAQSKTKSRLPEVDALRGLAVSCMLVFHFVLVGTEMDVLDVAFDQGGWHVLARFTQFLFLGLVGVSTWISRRDIWGQMQRAGRVFIGAMIVSAVTFAMFGDEYVRFGVLHLIAFSIPILALLKPVPNLAAALAVGILLLTPYAEFQAEWLYARLDYFPPLPWMILPLLGLFLASKIYGKQPQETGLKFLVRWPLFGWLGRWAFVIYLIHFPIFALFFKVLA